MDLAEKIESLSHYPVFASLPREDRDFLILKAEALHLSFQDLKQLGDIAADLVMWDGPRISALWDEGGTEKLTGKSRTRAVLDRLRQRYEELRAGPPDYTGFHGGPPPVHPLQYVTIESEDTILGTCPVAGEKTRCCNLQTLDAVQQCGFACSYCSIQSFYDEGRVYFIKNLGQKLRALELDPDRIYHIGTGQSSDSLMWGNREGLLDQLFAFARSHPNVVLELKTKSSNVAYLLENPVPPNIVATWSLNTQVIIENEEHLTASLEDRLSAARAVADRGVLVGFHFHPIVHYRGWEEEYAALYRTLQDRFSPEEVVMVSLGTLTYIKPVIRLLRSQHFKSKILQMPLTDAAGKLSYPFETKLRLFTHAYGSFSEEWKREVFFYMCMEDPRLWQPVFGREYPSNEDFETDMKRRYMEKVIRLSSTTK
jgi:spore photoproduct lyase